MSIDFKDKKYIHRFHRLTQIKINRIFLKSVKICVICGLISFLLFLTGGAYGDEGSLAKGREIFHERCALCHGVDGNPLLADVPSFARGERLDKTDDELLESIRHGKGDVMPAWEEVIPEKERKDVLGYVRVLVGDNIFAEKCVKCHEEIPDIPPAIPEDKLLKSNSDAIRICKGCDMEKTMTRDEQIEVLRFIRYLKK